jgi:GDP-L-fucose synthase
MKLLLFDSQGFISSHLEPLLLDQGHDVVTLDSMDTKKITYQIKSSQPTIIINCDAYHGGIHFVSKNPALVLRENVQNSFALYESVSRYSPKTYIVNLLPNCVYPSQENFYSESSWLAGPVDDSVFAMGYAKRLVQTTSKAYHIQHGIRSMNFIVPNGYGPEQENDPEKTHALNGIIIRMIQAMRSNKKTFAIWGSGNPKREWLYVKDLARFLAMIPEQLSLQIEPVNIGQNEAVSINETANIVKAALNYSVSSTHDMHYQDGVKIKKMSNTLFTSKYPLFVFTPFKKGVEETVEFFLEYLS